MHQSNAKLSECLWWEKPAANENVRRGNHLVESDTGGATTTEYIWLGSQRLAMVDDVPTSGGTLYYTHTDHLGTVQLLTDSGGGVVWSVDYNPFGEVTINPASTITYNLRMPGQYADVETGFSYNYFRTMDPGTGRFIESDPWGLNGGLNTYIYALQNPMTRIDELGLISCVQKANEWVKSCSNLYEVNYSGCLLAATATSRLCPLPSCSFSKLKAWCDGANAKANKACASTYFKKIKKCKEDECK